MHPTVSRSGRRLLPRTARQIALDADRKAAHAEALAAATLSVVQGSLGASLSDPVALAGRASQRPA